MTTQALVQMMCKSLNFIGTAEFHGGQIVIKDQTGGVKLSVDPALIPFIESNKDAVLLCINVVKAGVSEVQEQSTIIMPDKKIVRPS